MTGSVLRSGLLQAFSLLVAGLLLFSVFAVHTGFLGPSYVLPAVLTIIGAVAFRYAAVYHRFSRPAFRTAALTSAGVVVVLSGSVALLRGLAAMSLEEVRDVLLQDAFHFGAAEFLPVWWSAALLVPAGALITAGSASTVDLSPYPKPTAIREIAMSPVYFGFVCTVFGLWAVLLVGFAIQRVIVIAPLFEELLKFGVALLIGSALFGRSLAARIGVAIVAGSTFGLVEHATTYPTESDALFVRRTLFHTATAVLSVSVYSLFESRGNDRLRWISPAYSILLHFFNNAFAVAFAVLGTTVLGLEGTAVPLIFDGAVLLVATGLFVLALASRQAIVAMHEPFAHVLSDLV